MMEGDGVSTNGESGSGGNGTGSDGDENTGTGDSMPKQALEDEDISRPGSSYARDGEPGQTQDLKQSVAAG